LRQVAQLRELCGIGANSSWVFVMEFFGWRKLHNRREVSALAGLTPTPYDSGSRGSAKPAINALEQWLSREDGAG